MSEEQTLAETFLQDFDPGIVGTIFRTAENSEEVWISPEKESILNSCDYSPTDFDNALKNVEFKAQGRIGSESVVFIIFSDRSVVVTYNNGRDNSEALAFTSLEEAGAHIDTEKQMHN